MEGNLFKSVAMQGAGPEWEKGQEAENLVHKTGPEQRKKTNALTE